MQNLASIVTKEAIEAALEEALVKRPTFRPATKFHLLYKNERFPPKEVVRLAARKMGIKNLDAYRLHGGKSTNKHLEGKGFKIVQFAEWEIRKMLQPTANECRIARLTFNTNGWVYPSGITGKAKAKSSYEKTNGFGHEEWLLDFSKTIDGYHYSYLEPINKSLQKYVGKTFNIYLFTVNSQTNEKFWVGKLNNVEVINGNQSEKIKRMYMRKGWYDDMKEDLENLGIDSHKLDGWRASAFFNIRFRPEDFEPCPQETVITAEDESITSFHYVLLHVSEEPRLPKVANGEFILGTHNPSRRHSNKTIKKRYEEKLIEYPFIHHQISKALENLLRKDNFKVYVEHDTGFGTSIDLVTVKKNMINFYEIKTYNNVSTCIRQAIGQLLEYSYCPDRILADELFIVTPHKLKDQRLVTYIKHLNKHIGLPFRYMCFDLEKKSITQLI